MNQPGFERLGPYIIDRLIGSGGMGSVYLAVDERNQQQAAVKVLSPALDSDPSFRDRFATEIETLKKLKHPNIVELLGFGEQDGQLFYAMEYAEGRTFQDELRSGRRFHWREVARIGIEICQALKHAHDRGVIHRDLKPANLLYTEDEHVKLLDFGIAKLYGMSGLTIAGGVLGTVDYMAPEQADAGGITTRTDLYSLGSVLYALLAGHPPFVSRSVGDVMHKLKHEEPTPVRRLVPAVPEEFDSIISQMLEKDPQHRIATALAVANRLKAMEYALSLETQVDVEPNQSDDSDQLDEDEYRLADDFEEHLPADPDSTTSDHTLASQVAADDDSVQRHRRPTVAMSAAFGAGTSQPSTPAPVAGKTHFTTFDEEAQKRATRPTAPDESTSLWLKVAPVLLGGMAIVAGLWYVTRPLTADQLYRKIAAVAKSDEPRALSSVEDKMDEFLIRYPNDTRRDEVTALREDLRLYRLQRQYERRARLQTNNKSLNPVQRAYLEATRLATNDPAAAARKLQALLNVFSGAKNNKDVEQCLKLAREQLKQLQASAKELSKTQLKELFEMLDRADQLQATKPDQAAAIRRGIIELFGGKLWAEPAVQRAHAALQTR